MPVGLSPVGRDPALTHALLPSIRRTQHLRHVRVADVPNGVADGANVSASIHVHQLYDEEAAEEAAGDEEEGAVAFQMWTLPSLEFDGLWETLLYEEEVKPKLLRYVSTAMRFSELGVDSRVIAWNRVVLLHVRRHRGHNRPPRLPAALPEGATRCGRLNAWRRPHVWQGPPGTGKTSLCKGLAQKLAIRMSHLYAQACMRLTLARAYLACRLARPLPLQP